MRNKRGVQNDQNLKGRGSFGCTNTCYTFKIREKNDFQLNPRLFFMYMYVHPIIIIQVQRLNKDVFGQERTLIYTQERAVKGSRHREQPCKGG